jgi:polyisoprenoid-binding protein YceI
MFKYRLAVLIFLVNYTKFVLAVPKDYIPLDSAVHFVAVGKPAMLKIKGKSGDLKGKITVDADVLTANLQLNINSLETGIDTRDSHMKEKYLEAPKYPSVDLSILQLKLPANIENLKASSNEEKFVGELFLHGVRQQISGFYQIQNVSTERVKILAKYTVNLSDYKIDIPTYIGIKVADKVEVESQFELLK